MFGFEALELARFQFAFTVAFHIIFPSFTIGLASYLAVLEGMWLWKKDDAYLKVFNYWKTIFAVAFAMGVVSGIVMSYQFGTNWSVFSDKAGPVIGPLMGYEVLTAFFLEAGFLGIMLFGLNRVGPKLHFVSTLVVAFGTLLSAFWILSVNSWMQTPAGYAINEVGQYVPADWWEIVFNPSFPYRMVHMVLAAYLTTAFVVGAVGALHLLRDRHNRGARIMFSMAMWMALIVAPLQLIAGHAHGENTLEYQPAKIAAMEGHFETKAGQPLILFGDPDADDQTVHNAIQIPKIGSWVLTGDMNAEVKGLDAFPKEEWPPIDIVFWSFRIMVGIGMLMILVGLWSGYERLRGNLFDARWLQRLSVVMGPMGFVAVVAGWVVTEVGRQPWTIYGELTTAASASPIETPAVATSLMFFIVVYFILFGAGTFYLLRLMGKTPDAGESVDDLGPIRTSGITPGPAKSLERPTPAE
jgi:cytochrome d ubiquinol oxidase subunit I